MQPRMSYTTSPPLQRFYLLVREGSKYAITRASDCNDATGTKIFYLCCSKPSGWSLPAVSNHEGSGCNAARLHDRENLAVVRGMASHRSCFSDLLSLSYLPSLTTVKFVITSKPQETPWDPADVLLGAVAPEVAASPGGSRAPAGPTHLMLCTHHLKNDNKNNNRIYPSRTSSMARTALSAFMAAISYPSTPR